MKKKGWVQKFYLGQPNMKPGFIWKLGKVINNFCIKCYVSGIILNSQLKDIPLVTFRIIGNWKQDC